MGNRKRNASAAAFMGGPRRPSLTADRQNVTVIVTSALFTGDRFQQGVKVFQAGVFDDHPSAAVLVFDRNLQAEGSLQQIPCLTNVGVKRSFLFFFTLRFFLRIQQSLHVAFCLPDRHGERAHFLCGLKNCLRRLQRKEGARMAEAKVPTFHFLLHFKRKPKQPQEIRDRGPILACALRHLFLRHFELVAQAIVGTGLFHGVQVGALQILNDRHLHRLLVGNVTQDCRHGSLAGQFGGEPAAFAGDQLEAIVGQWPNQNRLYYAGRRNRGREFLESILVDAAARLERISLNLVDWNFPRLALVWWWRRRGGRGSRGKSRTTWKQGFKTLAKCAAFGYFNSSSH